MSNPYQLRFDVLAMAKEMADRAYDTQLDIAFQTLDMYKKSANEMFNSEEAQKVMEQYIPKMYTPEEVKAQAERLYEFVTKKD